MRQPPPLSRCFGYPITTSVAALAVVATVGWWNGADIGRLMMSSELCWRQPWRLLAPAHVPSSLVNAAYSLPAYPPALILIMLVAAVVLDLPRRGSRDWVHWLGVFCLGFGCAAEHRLAYHPLAVRVNPMASAAIRSRSTGLPVARRGVDNLRVPRETGNPRRLVVSRET